MHSHAGAWERCKKLSTIDLEIASHKTQKYTKIFMQTYEGTIKSWKQDRGFGFIKSASVENDIFIHIRDIKHSGYEPKVGDSVSYKLMSDKDGRIRAYDAYVKGQPAIQPVHPKAIQRNRTAGKRKPRLGIMSILIALTPFVFSAWLIMEQRNILPFVAYLVMSLLTFLVYARDKSKAHKNEWRTSESTLHLLELLGGWPGALITQKWIRHKNKKTSFQVTFWVIVIMHLAFWISFMFFPIINFQEIGYGFSHISARSFFYG
jgi:uncharacterized membrane protein YsdA (DUF1294 family)/cold shock CspA family protein